MTSGRPSEREDKAVEALIVAGMLNDPGVQQGSDFAADEAELCDADRAQLDNMPHDFVRRILDGAWVGHLTRGPDDSTVGDECIRDRVPR